MDSPPPVPPNGPTPDVPSPAPAAPGAPTAAAATSSLTPPVAPAPASRSPSGAPPSRPGPNIFRFLYTHNPFYILSAALVFWGLRSSFETGGTTFQTVGLMIGLLAYTILLAVTTYLVIRLGRIWQDGRSQLLLLVLLFLAISVSFDDTLRQNPTLGLVCQVGGLLFAIITSEALLWGIKLRLPAWYRIPYYLTLALSFLAPIGLYQFVEDPFDPRGQWGLFAFPALAGLAWLALLPAIRRGAAYVENNGSPWRWAWYPWSLFVLLALGVCQRSYFLCVSMHYARGKETIFGPYFLVPFLFVLAILLLEIGIVARSRNTLRLAVLVPAGLVALAATPITENAAVRFLNLFQQTLGMSPLFVTLVAVCAFYAWGMFRRVPRTAEGLSAALLALSIVAPTTRDTASLVSAQGTPFLMVAALQGALCLRKHSSFHCLLSLWCVVMAAAFDYRGTPFAAYGNVIPLHLLLAAMLLVGAVFRDPFAKFLQFVGAVAIFYLATSSLGDYPKLLHHMPAAWLAAYPVAAAAVAVAYGYLVGNQFYHTVAGIAFACWLATRGWLAYLYLRQLMAGLDYITWGLVSFLVAVFISLLKMGVPQRWYARWTREGESRPTEMTASPPAGETIAPSADRAAPSSAADAAGKQADK